MIYRYGIWGLVFVPSAVGAVLLIYAPQVIIGSEKLNASLGLSLAGVALSYYGLLFSSYAALEVRRISRKYLFKLRSPELFKKLRKVASSVSSFANEPADQLKSQAFIFELPVLLRASKKMKSAEVSRIAKRGKSELMALTTQANSPSVRQITAGEMPGYWALYQTISELADELREQIESVRAGE